MPNLNFNGTDTVTIEIRDDSQTVIGSQVIEIAVAAVNDTPYFIPYSNLRVLNVGPGFNENVVEQEFDGDPEVGTNFNIHQYS